MEKNKVKILSVKRNEITIKIKKEKHNFIFLSLCVFGLVMFLSLGIVDHGIIQTMATVYNPVNSLYNDNSDIVFTSMSNSLSFSLPIMGSLYEILSDGTIEFFGHKSIMIKTSELGVVEDVFINEDSKKCIKIRHADNVFSIVENIDIVGVNTGDIVKKGQDIATIRLDSRIKFSIYINNTKVSNIKIEQSKIVCQD